MDIIENLCHELVFRRNRFRREISGYDLLGIQFSQLLAVGKEIGYPDLEQFGVEWLHDVIVGKRIVALLDL